MVYVKKGIGWLRGFSITLLVVVAILFLRIGSVILGKDFVGKFCDNKTLLSKYLRNYSILNKTRADAPGDTSSPGGTGCNSS